MRATQFDLILMDVMMPGMDGIAATRLIRAEPGPVGQLPIIGLSAITDRASEAACRAAGMDGFVTKPANAERLASAIDAVLPARATESDDVGATPALNESVLRALAADIGEDGVAEVVTLFLAEAPAMLDRLARSSISGGRLLLREVHTLASAARNVGLLRVGAVAAAIEASLGTVEPKQECLLALQGLLRDGIARLAEWHERTHSAARLDADQCADGVTACSILAEHCA